MILVHGHLSKADSLTKWSEGSAHPKSMVGGGSPASRILFTDPVSLSLPQ